MSNEKSVVFFPTFAHSACYHHAGNDPNDKSHDRPSKTCGVIHYKRTDHTSDETEGVTYLIL
jgi:hypothetical protein